MLRGTRLVALSAALAAALLLTGCTADPAPAATVAPVPSATTTPAFSSKEEAFEAAERVYRQYLSASTHAGRQPKFAEAQDFRQYTTARIAEAELQSLERASEAGLHGSGPVILKKFVDQRFDLSSGRLSAYVCVDYSKSRVLNGREMDVTPASRPSTRTSIARFRTEQTRLLFDGQSAYNGKALC